MNSTPLSDVNYEIAVANLASALVQPLTNP